MKKELIMEAIGNISDRHVMEFADVSNYKIKYNFLRACSIAACICFVLAISLIVGLNNMVAPLNQDGEELSRETESDNHHNSIDSIEFGTVKISDSLAAAFMNADSDNEIFAIKVQEVSGADKKEVYQQFILKQGVEEDYLDKGIIYATKRQVQSFKCPDDMYIVLYPASSGN